MKKDQLEATLDTASARANAAKPGQDRAVALMNEIQIILTFQAAEKDNDKKMSKQGKKPYANKQ